MTTQQEGSCGKPPNLGAQLAVVLLSRTTLNTSFRIIYPFLPTLARGMGISMTAAAWLLTLRLLAGLVAPLLGPLSDHFGRRRVMELALVLFILAGLLLAGVGTLPAAGLSFILYGLAKVLYDPALYAYVGDTVAYHERGRAIGAIEMAWAGAWLLGVPAAGFLIEAGGWRLPWGATIILGLAGLILTRRVLPPAVRSQPAERRLTVDAWQTWKRLLASSPIRSLLLVTFLMTMAIEVPFIVYGAWLEDAFGLSLTALGLASTVVGLAELTGEFGTMTITDRLGKKRSGIVGLLGMVIALLLVGPMSGLGLAGALAGVALMLLFFEFSIVSLIPLVTELTGQGRATLISLTITSLSLGRIAGGFVGGLLWGNDGIALHAAVGAGCALLAALVLARGVGEM